MEKQRYNHRRKKQPEMGFSEEEETDLVEGRNAVLELLRSGRSVDKIWMASETSGKMGDIYALAMETGVVVTHCDRRKLDQMSRTGVHQGVIAQAAARTYVSVEDILQTARDKGEEPFILLCDGITDPHNLGAMIRSAETAGVHGVVIPKRRSVGLTAVCAKASAGAVEYMPVAKVSNLAQTIDKMKEAGVWVFGADADGDKGLYEADFRGATALVIGSEGEGISRIVREKCDFVVSIPMRGRVNSLNASAAAAVLLYEAVRQRQTEAQA